MKKLLLFSAIILFSINKVTAQRMVPAKDAAKYVGKKVTICDKVYEQDNQAFVVTFFLGADHPRQLLRVAIRFSDRIHTKNFFDTSFKGKDICVTGVVQNDKAGPYIRVNDPKQIRPYLVDTPVKKPLKTN